MTGKIKEPGAGVITGHPPETPSQAELTRVLLEVRSLLKSPDGSSLILDYRVRRAVFAIEIVLGGIRHGS